ncbi:MAG: hypothetical protein KA157_07615, partial [Aliarcobacter sp.]|nr:hypothetical protein [Aliarcobacter sp.]
MNSMDYYDYFLDNNNFFDLTLDEDKERLIKVLNSPIQKEKKDTQKKEKIIKPTDEIVYQYGLQNFKSKIETFHSLSPVEQGELFYDVKNLIKERF